MPPQIINLSSDDDEDFNLPFHSTGKEGAVNPTSNQGKTPSVSNKRDVAGSRQGMLDENIDLGSPFWEMNENEHILHNATSRSSTVSSHTERSSPSEERPRPTARRDNGKGKQREVEIPAIDLSQLDSDDDDDGVVLDSGNGDLSEDEALRRAIAMSLQEQTPRRESNESAGMGTSSASSGAAKVKVKASARPLKDVGSTRNKEDATTQTPDDGTISPSPSPSPAILSNPHQIARGLLTPPSPGLTPTTSAADVQAYPTTTRDGPGNSAPTPIPRPPLSSPSDSTFSLANLDRQQMEAERLARRKRKLEGEGSNHENQGGEGHSAKVVKLGQPATATATATDSKTRTMESTQTGTRSGSGSIPPNQQQLTDNIRRNSGNSNRQLQLAAKNNRPAAAAPVTAVHGFNAGQRTAATEATSSSRKAEITGNSKSNTSGVVPPSMNAALPNPTPTPLPPTINIDDDGDNDDFVNNITDTTATATTSNTNNSALNLYPEGIALKTYIAGHSSADTITFAKLVSPSSRLESCLLSSFIWDFDWVFPHFETRRTKFQLVMHARDAAQREALVRDFQGVPNVRLTFPPMGTNVNCMHSKLMLLFYKDEGEEKGNGNGGAATATVGNNALGGRKKGGGGGGQRCRIVVPTANLVDFDWGVGDFMENTVWLIDLPAKPLPASTANSASLDGATAGRSPETSFEKSLKAFLTAQTVPDDVVRKLDLFDFRRTERYGFVHTIGGMHGGQEAWQTTGLCGLGRTITELGLAARGGPIQMDYVTSSVGSLNDDFLRSMHLAASGDSGLTEYTMRYDKGGRVKHGNWKENFRFYFPSDDTVRTSRGGPRKAGTICFAIQWWNNPKFPRSNMYDCVSIRQGLLMHNKLLFVRYTSPVEKAQPGNIGWAYVGSANLSESAWGRLVQDKATKKPRLNCRNWECGVIIPIPAVNSSPGIYTVKDTDSAGLASFNHTVPVPMRVPSECLENKIPWVLSE
ncbi:uncharacterized protein Z519_10714 [Cladophialophora bantiana CBS 173.52]|uniref:PLD phosphodiesterase domain-containing protein n=1 Tax=Cladophialophora bantiana (strain ATCC 10958 / CBS 173.52 / CDC B-1940 / NIH 8579) TaxID=1442370 RepID=A0A0D2H5T2_CLAB1|nr:uncharacterized protein Z519_10714 [Cladophialophora bantiana CBS 173.52]KIW88668.1 hypothetical protein Z519_10714 [Cladophialophora bantiana CBS 173.52]